MTLQSKIKQHFFDLIHHFVFTSWAFVWIYTILLSTFILIFLNEPFKYNPDFDFFAYQNSPITVQNIWVAQLVFIFLSFMLSYVAHTRLPKVDKLLAFFSFLTLLSLTFIFYPIIIGILIAPKAI